MLLELKTHLNGRPRIAEQISVSETLKEDTIEESTGLTESNLYPSCPIDITVEAEPRFSTEGSFICGLCGKTFEEQNNRNRHEKRHEQGRPHQCVERGCGKSFKTKDSVKKHTQSVRHPSSLLLYLLIYLFRSTRKKHFFVSAVIRYFTDVII